MEYIEGKFICSKCKYKTTFGGCFAFMQKGFKHGDEVDIDKGAGEIPDEIVETNKHDKILPEQTFRVTFEELKDGEKQKKFIDEFSEEFIDSLLRND